MQQVWIEYDPHACCQKATAHPPLMCRRLGAAKIALRSHHGGNADNVFVERLWHSANYEKVYLRAYTSVAEARSSIGAYLDLHNRKQPHSRLDGRRRDHAFLRNLVVTEAA